MIEMSRIERNERKAFRALAFSVGALVVVLLSGLFIGFAYRNAHLVREVVADRGKSLFKQVVLTRRWAAAYGGVYVKKVEGVESNPWLEHPDLELASGEIVTLRNPALITRELSELAALDPELGYRFKITSLRPVNPNNAPDELEAEALWSFEEGVKEFSTTVEGAAGKEFRYIGALITERSCLACHATQGYAEGQVRGAISVAIPVQALETQLARNTAAIIVIATLVSFVTIGAVAAIVIRFRKKLDELRDELERAAIRDGLTGLYNRAFALDRLRRELEKAARGDDSIAIGLFDADDFKRINDELGHHNGDRALRAIAEALQSASRPYDTVARYGGEEFLAVLPGATDEQALQACERWRSAVEAARPEGFPAERRITVSVGICYAKPRRSKGGCDELLESMLKAADDAMYAAKSAGKNRCVVAPTLTPAP
jgi:diguanylate cyclase (GGDEF)-like protein